MGVIPAWNSRGVLPPIDVQNPASPDRSPYLVTLLDFVLRFGQSPERRKILKGYFDFRASLHAAGLTDGFQWIDGGFIEDIETTAKRPPNDVDVVTFYKLPVGVSQSQFLALNPNLDFGDSTKLKAKYRVDGYPVNLDMKAELLVDFSTYWYSLFSHRRDTMWRGILRVDLSPAEDAAAIAALAGLNAQGAQP
jgi:hypothetical protein